ncbi:MAG: amino acid ABC transporter permease [Sciscionella sp.]
MTATLFDVAGPKTRARHGVYAIGGSLVVVAIVAFVLYRLWQADQLQGSLWTWLQYTKIQIGLLTAIRKTLQAFAMASVLALVFGSVFAMGRLSQHAWLRVPSTIIVEFFRAVPLVIMMFVFYYGLPAVGVKMSAFLAVVLGLTLYNGSVLAEVFRAGVLSLPHGQSEAAYALGMRKTQVMISVLLPQALRAMLPAIVSQLTVLLKDTALGFIITYDELLYYIRSLGSQVTLHHPLIPVMIVGGGIYVIMCLLLSWLAHYLEGRNRRSKKHIDLEPGDGADPDQIVLGGAAEAGDAGGI